MSPISRPARSLGPNAARSPKAPAPQACGTAEGSSSSGAVSGMKPKEASLAGYLLARAAMNRKVEDPGLKNLRAGHESVQQVSELLPLGRANVIQDIERAKGEHISLRKLASHKLEDDLIAVSEKKSGVRMTETDYLRVEAASSQYAKTGTCGSFAANTTPLHAAKLADMEDKRAIVAQSEHATINHAWSEMMPKGKRDDGSLILHGQDVIMDGWCKNNLAVFREDSQYARLGKDGKADHLKHHDFLDHETGPKALEKVRKFKAEIAGNQDLQGSFKRQFDRLVEEKYEWQKKNLWDAESVFHDDFRERAGKALHKGVEHVQGAKDVQAAKHAEVAGESRAEMKVRARAERFKHASMAEIQAVGVAQSLGANIRGAKAEAPEILAAAKGMFPRTTSKE